MYPNSFPRHWQWGFFRRYLLKLELLSGRAAFVGVFWKVLDGKEVFCEGAAPAWSAGEGVEWVISTIPLLEQFQSHNSPFFLWDFVTRGQLGCPGAAPQHVPLLSTVKKEIPDYFLSQNSSQTLAFVQKSLFLDWFPVPRCCWAPSQLLLPLAAAFPNPLFSPPVCSHSAVPSSQPGGWFYQFFWFFINDFSVCFWIYWLDLQSWQGRIFKAPFGHAGILLDPEHWERQEFPWTVFFMLLID